MRFLRSKKGIVLLAAAAIAVVAAVVGYAFFTASGTGTGTATVGTASGVQLSSDPVDGLLPGAPATAVAVHVHNPGAGTQFVGEIDGVVATNGECLGSWFTVAPISFAASVNAGATSDASTTIAMVESNTNQDACQGKTVTIDWSTGTGSGGGGGTQTNLLVIGDCRWDDGSIDSADFPVVGPHMSAFCNLDGGSAQIVCQAGFVDHDGNLANGCELDITGSGPGVTYVGACPAGGVPNATWSCSSNTVTYTCLAGYADLDGNPANGCETSFASFAIPQFSQRATSGWA